MKAGPQNTNKQRSRGRGNNGGKKHLPPRNQTFDSNGPDIRIRGNAHQVLEKYLAMARDATAQGDRISAENYYQHAEHYFRVINASNNGLRRPHMPTPAEDHLQAEDAEDAENEENNGIHAADNDGPEQEAVNA